MTVRADFIRHTVRHIMADEGATPLLLEEIAHNLAHPERFCFCHHEELSAAFEDDPMQALGLINELMKVVNLLMDAQRPLAEALRGGRQ